MEPIALTTSLASGLQRTEDTPNTIDLNSGKAVETVDAWLDGLVALLPNILVAIAIAVGSFFLASIVSSWILAQANRRDRANLGEVLGGFVKAVVIVLGVLIAATIVFPKLNPSDLIAGLGVSSVAIGFAFKDILQNWLAGLLILFRQPFEVGDQIVVGGFEGTVEKIETRATLLKTYDNQRVVIPNSDIYTDKVLVKTAMEQRRRQYDVGIGYGDDVDEACRVLKEAVQSCEGVLSEHEVETLPWDLAAAWVTIRVRWWCDSDRASVVATTARVISAMKKALDEAGIDMPYPTEVHLFHDQTEAVDGDRSKQREGWPAGVEPSTPRWRARLAAHGSDDEDPNNRNGVSGNAMADGDR